MSPSIIPASAPPARFSLDRHPHMDAPAVPVRRTSSRIRQAAAYVGLLVWGGPLAAFVVAAVHADATPCAVVAEVPCNDQGVVVLTAVLAATLLIPVGLLTMLLVAALATAVPSKAPVVLAVLASASVVVVAGGVWGIVSVVTT